MICEERLLKILYIPHMSEKVSIEMEKRNTIVLKVEKDANKLEIKYAVRKLFEVKVNNIRTLIVKGKTKRCKKNIGRRSDWKKAYITLKKGQNVDFMSRVVRG